MPYNLLAFGELKFSIFVTGLLLDHGLKVSEGISGVEDCRVRGCSSVVSLQPKLNIRDNMNFGLSGCVL